MARIKNLSSIPVAEADDELPIYDKSNDADRKVTVATLAARVDDLYGLRFARDRFTVSGLGPYTLTNTPNNKLLIVLLDAYELDESQYTMDGKSLTLVGVTPGDFVRLVVRYTF